MPLTRPPITIFFANNGDKLSASLRELLDSLSESAHLSQKVVHLLFGSGNRFREFFRFNTDSTSWAGVTVSLEPTDRFAELVAAVRAGNIDSLVVE